MSSETEDTLKKKTVPLLRAVLAAKAKEGIPMHMLCCEFQEQTFGPLKFKDMGYGSLEQYLRDCPETCIVQRAREGYLVVKGVASEEDAHVYKLVGGQRKDKKKKPKRFSGLTVKRRASHFTGGRKPNFRPTFIGNNNFSPSPHRFSILGTPPATAQHNTYKKLRDAPSTAPSTRYISELAPRFQKKKGNPFLSKVQTQINDQVLKTSQKQVNNIIINDNQELQMTVFQNNDCRTKKTTHFSSSQPSSTKSYEAPGGKSKTTLSADALVTLGRKLRELLMTKSNGLWATRLQPEFKTLYGDTLPDDIREIIQENFLSFIKIECPMPHMEILHLKESQKKEADPESVQIPREVKYLPEVKEHTQISSNSVNSSHQDTQNNYNNRPLSIKINSLPNNGNVPHVPIVNGSLSHDKDDIISTDVQPIATHDPISQKDTKKVSPRNNLFKIPPSNLPNIGDEIKVFVCHVESLDRFFVQFADSTIAELVNDMQLYYEDSTLIKEIDKPRLDEFCCARYSKDQVWCRAKILSVKEQKNIVNVSYCCRVIFVDYGNDEYVISTELNCLTDEFCKLPSQGVQCCLNNLYPMREGSTWSEKVTEHFRQVTDGVELTMCVKQRNGSVLSVDLIDANGQSVSAYFCTSRIARISTPAYLDDTASSDRSSHSTSDRSSHSTSPRTPPSPAKKVCISGESDGQPEYVVVPEEQDYIDVSVSHINSSSDIVIVLIGPEFNDKLDRLEEKMSKYYEKEPLHVTTLEVNSYYAVPYDDYWVRVKLLSLNDNDLEVILLDHGNKTFVTRDEIKVLHSQFYKLPFQAIPCSLANVPESFDAEILQYLNDNTHGKDLIGYIVERQTGTGSKMSVELYDTTNESDDININTEIIAKIENEQNLTPKFPEELGVHCNAYIAHISSTGDAFIQILGPGTARLEILMEDMTSHFIQTRASEIVQRPEVGTICCAKFCDDGAWYRAKVTKVMQKERKVEVEFIDYGNREVIQMLFIRNPDAVNKQVLSLPPQAVKCRIADYSDLNLTEDTYKKMREFAQSLDNVYVSVVEYKDSIPVINILVPSEHEDEEPMGFMEKYQYIQSELEKQATQDSQNLDITDESSVFDGTCSMSETHNTSYEDISVASEGSFCTINPIHSNSSSATLLSEYDVINNVPGIKDSQERNRSESPAIMFSTAWGIPQMMIMERIIEGVILDSHDPSKFCFVPYSMWESLETMHVEMMEAYRHSISDNVTFAIGDVCAAYHAKHEIWYRAIIVAEIEDQVVVKYLDFSGTVEVESAKNIRPLHTSFKKLPFLAVRCTLAGIEPVGGAKNWDIETATLFNEMVMNETFQIEVIEGFCTNNISKPLEVSLHGASEDGKSFVVNEKLISLGLARRVRVR